MRVTIEHATIVKKVYLNDEDVTSRCYEADDKKGYVMLYKKDEEGNFIFTGYIQEGRDVAREKLEGNVRIELIEGVNYE